MKLFKAAMERVLWRHKTQMWKKVRKILVPLYLRMSDETHSVAKVSAGDGGSRRGRRARGAGAEPRASAASQASQEALMAAAELLWWDELKDVAHMEQTWRIRACLVRAASAARLAGGSRGFPEVGGWGGKKRGRGGSPSLAASPAAAGSRPGREAPTAEPGVPGGPSGIRARGDREVHR